MLRSIQSYIQLSLCILVMLILGQGASGKFVSNSPEIAYGDFFELDLDRLEKKPEVVELHLEIFIIELRTASGVIYYAYCHNDPVNKVDVLGLEEVNLKEAVLLWYRMTDENADDGYPQFEISPVKPGTLKGKKGINIFLNGIRNEENDAAISAWANTGKKSGFLVYNPTEGLPKDLAECVDGSTTGSTKISRSVSDVLKKSGVDFTTLTIHMHSQGGIIGTNVINQLGKEGVNVRGLKALYYMPGNNRKTAIRKLNNHGARIVSWYQNSGDLVTQVAGVNGITDFRLDRVISSLIAAPTLGFGGRSNSNHSMAHGAIEGYARFTNYGHTWVPEGGWRKGLPDHLDKNPKHMNEVLGYGKK